MYLGKVPQQFPIALCYFLVFHVFSFLILSLIICKNTYKCEFYEEHSARDYSVYSDCWFL